MMSKTAKKSEAITAYMMSKTAKQSEAITAYMISKTEIRIIKHCINSTFFVTCYVMGGEYNGKSVDFHIKITPNITDSEYNSVL